MQCTPNLVLLHAVKEFESNYSKMGKIDRSLEWKVVQSVFRKGIALKHATEEEGMKGTCLITLMGMVGLYYAVLMQLFLDILGEFIPGLPVETKIHGCSSPYIL